MPLGTYGAGLGPYWAVIQPAEKTNLVTNPSFELGTSGWGTLAGGTIGSVAGTQAFGVWAGSVAPSSSGTAGVFGGTWTSNQGTTYTASVYVLAPAGSTYRMAIGAGNGQAYVGSVAFTGGGTWHRYSASYTEQAVSSPRTIVVIKDNSANTDAFYIDGAQAEINQLTTYIDGDQEECAWLGPVHAAQSYRSGQSRAGGSMIALADLGVLVEDAIGIGMPPVENNAQSYAMIDGAQFQRQRAAPRMITLTVFSDGNTQQAFHTTRRKLLDAIKIDAVSTPQPVRFVYIGAGGTSFLDAVYQAGLDGGAQTGFSEQSAAQFVAYDPYWHAERDMGTQLVGRQSIGSANYIAWRDRMGQWGTLGVNGQTVLAGTAAWVTALAVNPGGTIFVGGDFNTAGGTTARGIARYAPTTNTFGTLGSAFDPGQVVRTIVFSPTGTAYIGGDFLGVNGTAGGRFVVQWNGAFGTLIGGTVNGTVARAAFSPQGTLVVAGQFTQAAGTAARLMALWNNGAWGTTTNGTLGGGGSAMGLAFGLDGQLYVTGDYTSAGGTATGGAARWNGTWWALGNGVTAGLQGTGLVLRTLANGVIVAGGNFGTAGGGSALALAAWNGARWAALGSGLTQTGGAAGTVTDLAVLPNGELFAIGSFQKANTIPIQDNLVRWTGGAYVPGDIDISSGVARCLLVTPSGTLYIGGNFNGTAQAAVVTQLNNPGMAAAYPTVSFYNPTSGTIRISQLVNATTGDGLFFDLALLAGETATLKLTPGARSFTSDYRGNLFSKIAVSSNLSTWRLLPGTNAVSHFADSASVVTQIVWRPRHWSADGTI